MAMNDRTLNISKGHIIKAARDNEYLEALAFAIMIKANHRNSMMLNASKKSIMKFLHCNSSKADKIKRSAINLGLIRTIGTNVNHLLVPKFKRKSKERTVRLIIHKNDDGSLHAYIKSNFKEKKDFPYQTIADVKNLILAIAVLICVDKHNGYINTLKNSKSREYSLRIKEERCCRIRNKDRNANKLKDREISRLNKGCSYGEILQHMFKNSIGTYKVRQLIKFLETEKLLKVIENIIPIKKIYDGESTDKSDWMVYDKDKGKEYRYIGRNSYYSKRKKRFYVANSILSDDLLKIEEGERMLCIQFANNYLNTSDYLKFTIHENKTNKERKKAKKLNECQYVTKAECENLPFFWG